MEHDAQTVAGTHTAPTRNLSRGVKSLIVLGALGSMSAMVGILSVNSTNESGIGTAAAAPAPPPLAVTAFSAIEFEPGLVPPQRVSGELKNRETLTDLVTRLGASSTDANAALHSLYDKDLLDARRLLPGLEAEAFLMILKLERRDPVTLNRQSD